MHLGSWESKIDIPTHILVKSKEEYLWIVLPKIPLISFPQLKRVSFSCIYYVSGNMLDYIRMYICSSNKKKVVSLIRIKKLDCTERSSNLPDAVKLANAVPNLHLCSTWLPPIRCPLLQARWAQISALLLNVTSYKSAISPVS